MEESKAGSRLGFTPLRQPTAGFVSDNPCGGADLASSIRRLSSMNRLKGLLSWGPIAASALLFSVSPAALAQNTVPFSVNAPGVTKAVAEWGIDTALYYHD